MQKSEIKPRTEYAFREKRVVGGPIQCVRVLEHIRGNKWKVEWIEPNPCLVHYVESSQLLFPWKERKGFPREEENRERLVKHNHECGYSDNSPVAHALYHVFESVGQRDVSFYKGVLSASPEALDRVRARAGVTTSATSAYGYRDGQGNVQVPFDEAVELARKFCAAEPLAVLVGVETTERDWSEKARTPGNNYMVPLLTEYRAAWALIRQWAGHDPAIAARGATIQKLERLVYDAIYAFQKAGLDSEAARLRRAVQRE